jgi:ATP-binding cassette, subfamily B, bacterial CvaB/MchF/RaxB
VCNPILTEIIDDHRNPAAPLQHSMKSARRGGLAAFSYTTSRDTTFTVGMLVAFLAYKTQFVTRSVSLIEQAIGFKMLSIHLERLTDIVLTEVEQPDPVDGVTRKAISGRLALRNVSFRYAEGEDLVLDDCSCEIEAGKSTVIVGQTGSGKTTLARIMLGLLEPEHGDVMVDGQRLSEYGRRVFRLQTGTVMQDDQLFAGSIVENITFFHPEIDMGRVTAVTKIAQIHEDIMAMPMKYETLVGDMGSALSGGQKQRVLLARAIYSAPPLLVLDESTSHLDIFTEQRVSQAISEMGITRIQIAHRPETIRKADQIILMENGKIRAISHDEFFQNID